MTTLQRLFTFSAAGGRELRLKARPPARFISHSNTQKHIHITEPKHEPETAHPLRVPRCLLSVSQRDSICAKKIVTREGVICLCE